MEFYKKKGFKKLEEELKLWIELARTILDSGVDDRVDTKMHGFEIRLRAIQKTFNNYKKKFIIHNPPMIQLQYKFEWEKEYKEIHPNQLLEWMYKNQEQ